MAGAHRVRPGLRRPSAAPAGAAAIGDQLARALLAGEVADGDTVRVDVEHGPDGAPVGLSVVAAAATASATVATV